MVLGAMNAKRGTREILSMPGYLFEPKFDGFRALCVVKGKKISFISRNGVDLSPRYPELASVLKCIKAKSCVLDGEIIALDKKGKPRFSALQGGNPVQYRVFDILEKNGKTLISFPLQERKKILNSTVINGRSIKKVTGTRNGTRLWKEEIREGGEGVMAKELHSLYYPGQRKKVWLKIKQVETVDAVVIGFTSNKRAISSLALGLYNDKHELTYIGKVGTGFNEDEIAFLSEELQKKIIKAKGYADAPRGIIWVKPRLVVEVKYAELTEYGKLRSPVFLRIRTDKKPKDCTIKDQLS